MKKKKNTLAQVIATLALLGIVAGIIGTGILVIFGGWEYSETPATLSQEEIDQLIQDYENTQSGVTLSGSLLPDTLSE